MCSSGDRAEAGGSRRGFGEVVALEQSPKRLPFCSFTYCFLQLIFTSVSSFYFLTFFNVYLFLRERERECVSRGGAEREGDAESEAGSGFRAVSTEPDTGLELKNLKIVT